MIASDRSAAIDPTGALPPEHDPHRRSFACMYWRPGGWASVKSVSESAFSPKLVQVPARPQASTARHPQW